MNPFVYYTPTEIVFENDAELRAGQMLKKYGASKVLIHYGGGSCVRSGLLDRVVASITACGIEYVTLGGVQPNPRMSLVKKGIELCRAESVDFILAVGGGSTIDSSKAIGFGLKYEGDVTDLFNDIASPSDCMPIASILTIPAAGSEMSDSAVITIDDGMLKRYAGHQKAICKFSLMNPKLTLTLPDYQTACGIVDMIMHTMERYFSNLEHLDITDKMAEGVFRSVIQNAKILREDPQNMSARWNIMWAGSLAHNGLTGCGVLGGDWSTHDIEHELGGMFDVAHGAGLASVWGSWARYVVDVIPHRFAKFGVEVLGLDSTIDTAELAHLAIKGMEDFFEFMGMPTSVSKMGINLSDSQIDELSEKATHFGVKKVGSVIKLGKADIAKILQMAK